MDKLPETSRAERDGFQLAGSTDDKTMFSEIVRDYMIRGYDVRFVDKKNGETLYYVRARD